MNCFFCSPYWGCFTFQPCQIHQSPQTLISSSPSPNIIPTFTKSSSHQSSTSIRLQIWLSSSDGVYLVILALSLSGTNRASVSWEHLPNAPTATSRFPFLISHYKWTDIFRSSSRQPYIQYVRIITGFWQVWNIFLWKGIQAVWINYWV